MLKEVVSGTCPECGAPVVKDREYYCSRCGLVVSSYDIVGDKQTFDNARTGPPRRSWLYDGGMGTVISYRYAISKNVRDETSRAILKLIKNHGKHIPSEDRQLATVLGEISRICSVLEIPEYAKEYAARIYRAARKHRLYRGRATEVAAAAVVYAACKVHALPISLKRISDTAGASQKHVYRVYKRIRNKMEIEVCHLTLESYLEIGLARLEVNGETANEAREISRYVQENNLCTGRSPRTLAGAIIYLCCRKNELFRSQRRIADALEVTEAAIRAAYKELREALGVELPCQQSETTS